MKSCSDIDSNVLLNMFMCWNHQLLLLDILTKAYFANFHSILKEKINAKRFINWKYIRCFKYIYLKYVVMNSRPKYFILLVCDNNIIKSCKVSLFHNNCDKNKHEISFKKHFAFYCSHKCLILLFHQDK
jgi:hypothetical protein